MLHRAAQDGASVIIKCKDDPHVLDTIASAVGADEIIVALVHNPDLRYAVEATGARVVDAPDDNVGASSQMGLEAARYECCIITDSDTVLGEGYIVTCREALERVDLCRGPIHFLSDPAVPGSEVVARVRNYFNNIQREPYMPGLAVRRSFALQIGGFDRDIRWAIDYEFGVRSRKAGALYAFFESAAVEHLPITVSHDLKAARRTGKAMHCLDRKNGIARHRLRYGLASVLYEPFIAVWREVGASACLHHVAWLRAFHAGYWE